MRPRFAVGSNISWKQFRAKGDAFYVTRTGAIWSDAPSFEGGGSFVWVIPNEKRPDEKSAIAVRVHRSGARRGEAEIYEDSAAYRESLKDVSGNGSVIRDGDAPSGRQFRRP